MTAPSPNWCKKKRWQPSVTARNIVEQGVGNQWEVLDFEDIDKGLALKLTDDDMRAILLCVDSVNHVKKLKLAGCVNIIGHGLEPLRGSLSLQQIDLSLAGWHESPPILTESKISEEAILPILWSIIEKDGISLRHLQLPTKWCGRRQRSAAMYQFLQQYSAVLEIRSFSCVGGTHSTERCFGTDGEDWIDYYGRQGFTCYECLENVCDNTADDIAIKFCRQCKKLCRKCAKASCYRCTAREWDACITCDV